MPFIDENFLLQLKDTYKNYNIFIETGTFKGETIFKIENLFEQLYTIEIKKELYDNVKKIYDYTKRNKINFLLGDSAILLKDILNRLKVNDKIILFLDAHWSSGVTGKSSKDVPLIEEIKIINNMAKNQTIIIIDDYRLFGKGPNKGGCVENWEDINKNTVLEILKDRITNVYHLPSKYHIEDRLIIHLTALPTMCYGRGRLCNQIFRNIAVNIIAQKHDLWVKYNQYDKITSLGIDLFVGKNKHHKIIDLNDNNYLEVLNRDKLDVNLEPNDAYFQSKHVSDLIYKYLQSTNVKKKTIDLNPFKNRYNNNNDLFIHIRLTDTIKWNPGLEYYLDNISKINFDNLYIASDDFSHVIIKDIIKIYPNAKLIEYDPIKTLQFGNTCKNIILSNGTFSAMIGYLSFSSNIYYPNYERTKHMWNYNADIFSMPNWNPI